ncbi:hypothetical protein LUZ60_004561 [Juncus effusus]|nr:hypothetical protein LUZ60_004561 [Juncus effusus]
MASHHLQLLSLLFLSLTPFLVPAKKDPLHLHFYMQELVAGPNPTSIVVAKGPTPLPGTPYRFGDIAVVDDALTQEPEPNSTVTGRAQGFFTVMKSDPSVDWVFNLVLSCGEYNGSSLAIVGRDLLVAPVRELAIVGGSGAFRMARGYVLLKTYSVNVESGDAVLELDAFVYLFDEE